MPWLDFAICFCFGFLGIHKFKENNKKWGIIYLCTMGLFGFGWMYDSVVYFVNALKGQRSLGKMAGKQLRDNDPLPITQSTNALIHNDEICHYSTSATHVKNKNVVFGYNGVNKGVSIRIAKGMSYRVGTSKSQPIRGDIQEKTNGIFTITNKRIIFSADKGAFDKKISSLSSMTLHSDGISFQFGENQYPLILKEPVYVYQIIARIVNTSKD